MKHIITIGAILLLAMLAIAPASAVWHNGVFYTDEQYAELIDGATVVHNGQTGVDSKYRPVDNGLNTYQYSCDLRGSIRAHTNTLSKEIVLSNDIDPNATTTIPILSVGSFEFTGLAYGNYTLTLVGEAGNGGQTEISKVVCAAPGGVVYPQTELLGHAVGQFNAVATCQREIVSATYGAQICHDEVSHIVHHDVTARLANWWGYGYEYGHVHAENTHGNHYDFMYNGHKYHITNDWWDTAFIVTPEYDETVIDNEAYCEGETRDVTSNVREVVAKGHLSFVFSNGWLGNYEGGIFDNPTDRNLLSSIDDPAKNIEKTVSITYKDCSGFERDVTAEEYEVINLS